MQDRRKCVQLKKETLRSLPSDRSLLVNEGAVDITWFSLETDDCLCKVSFLLTPNISK